MEVTFDPFEVHFLFRGGVTQTILGSKFPGDTRIRPRVSHRVEVGPRARLLILEIPPKEEDGPVVLLTHGMGGCSESGYMKRISRKLWEGGAHVFMMNQRGAGPSMGMSDSLWNGGSSDDLEHAVRYIIRLKPGRPLLLVGFSLSGNVLLKYLGEGRLLPASLKAAMAVNPPIDLRTSSRIISSKSHGGMFNRYYMKLIHRQREALEQCFPDSFLPPQSAETIWEFDKAYTAPAAGFADVEDYYTKCSSKQFLRFIKLPTTLLCSRDDPFIPPEVFDNAQMSRAIRFCYPKHGGHMGYIAKKETPFGDHRWMDYVIAEWVKHMGAD